MKRLFCAMLVLGLCGCSSTSLFKGTFENRLACSLDGKEIYFLSKYGWASLGAEVSAKDMPAECRKLVTPPSL